MLYPLPAIAAFVFTRNSKITPGMRAGATAVAAVTPSVLGIVPAVVAATAAGGGTGFGRVRRPQMRYQTATPPPPADPTPSFIQVPSGMVGQPLANAQTALQTADLVAEWTYVWSQQPDGNVLTVHPHEGAVVALNSSVRLTVSKNGSPPPDPTPAAEMTELKAIEGQVTDLKKDVDGQLGTIQSNVGNLQTDVDKRLGTLQTDVGDIKSAIADLSKRVPNLKS